MGDGFHGDRFRAQRRSFRKERQYFIFVEGWHKAMPSIKIQHFRRRPQLEYLVTHTTVNRVLVSDRLTQDDLDDLVDYVRSISRRDTKLRLRVAPAAQLHDRHVINDDRVLQIGGISSAGAGTTVLSEPLDLGGAVREYYRSIWKQARKLATYKAKKKHSKVDRVAWSRSAQTCW